MKTLNFTEEIRELIAGSRVISNQITVVNVFSSAKRQAVAAFIEEEYLENILVIQDQQYGVFYSAEIEAHNFARIILDGEYGAKMTSNGHWEVPFRIDQPYHKFIDFIKDKLLSKALVLCKTLDLGALNNDITLINSGIANDIREGFNFGMEEAQEVLYKIYCFSSILQNSLQKAKYNPKNLRDKMALILLKKEIEEFVQSENYLLCAEMTKCGVCHVLSRHRQNYVQKLLDALEEITK